MLREIITIDRELCNGCGDCVPNCAEGALQMIDGKATLISDLLCDGLGACVGHCPVGAITIVKREAVPYDEVAVMKEMVKNGKNVIIAHLKHLKEHGQTDFLKQGVKYLHDNQSTLSFEVKEIIEKVHNLKPIEPQKQKIMNIQEHSHGHSGCPGSRMMSFEEDMVEETTNTKIEQKSELRQWPIQLHLISPMAPYFQKADLLIAADCVAFSMGGFHQNYLKGKGLVIACPKLDSQKDIYVEKMTSLINDAKVNTITVMKMEVPCCGGILQMVKMATENATRNVPIKSLTVSLKGELIAEEWV